ncbi:hypothetical protein CDL15_Pgr020764 [Punica granatum]|nr:hypothetical protein CDL15_Pgr020764 [Punica granatum]
MLGSSRRGCGSSSNSGQRKDVTVMVMSRAERGRVCAAAALLSVEGGPERGKEGCGVCAAIATEGEEGGESNCDRGRNEE